MACSLKEKDWKLVTISQLKPVKFEVDSSGKLVIDSGHKTIVRAMVKLWSNLTWIKNLSSVIWFRARERAF